MKENSRQLLDKARHAIHAAEILLRECESDSVQEVAVMIAQAYEFMAQTEFLLAKET